ncbi:MAG: outer membrane lipoprotein LolB [Polaribacter sp.]|jgi:outer membrane lipoprotein LolB
MTKYIHASLSPLLTVVLVAFIGACSQQPTLQVTQESKQKWDLLQQQLVSIDEWEIHARAVILLRSERYNLSDGRDDSAHQIEEGKVYPVGINWSRQQDRFSMVIEAPFGQGVIRIESNLSPDKNRQFKLTLADGEFRLGATPEALLVSLLGWSIPVNGLKSWVKGLPQPDVESSYEIYGSGRLKSLRQNGWLVNYLAYFPEEKQPQQLPKQLFLKHENIEIKIVIERWGKHEASVEPESIFPDFDRREDLKQ